MLTLSAEVRCAMMALAGTGPRRASPTIDGRHPHDARLKEKRAFRARHSAAFRLRERAPWVMMMRDGRAFRDSFRSRAR